MFGRQSGHGGNSGSSNLVEFRAGRMNMIGKMVHPDTRKGLLYLHQSEDGLMHFCWKDRTTNKVEDDLIVFPDEYEFKRVDQCTTGRVFVLKFKTSSRRMFFWMQEPKSDKDEELCRRVNELMNNPPSAQRGSGSDSGDLQYMLNNMSQQQLMQLFGGVGQMGGLSSLLGSMNRSGDGSSRSATRGGSSANLSTPENSSVPRVTPSAPKRDSTKTFAAGKNKGGSTDGGEVGGRSIDLSTAITTSEAIAEIADDAQQAKKLAVYLPTSENVDEDKKKIIMDTINSPQFQQALTHFSNALQSAQLGPVVSQFELSSDAISAAYSGNLEAFVKALEKTLPEGTTISSDADGAANNDSATASPDKSSGASKESYKDKETANKKSEDNANATTKKEE